MGIQKKPFPLGRFRLRHLKNYDKSKVYTIEIKHIFRDRAIWHSMNISAAVPTGIPTATTDVERFVRLLTTSKGTYEPDAIYRRSLGRVDWQIHEIKDNSDQTINHRHKIPLTAPALHILHKWQAMGRRKKYMFDLVKVNWASTMPKPSTRPANRYQVRQPSPECNRSKAGVTQNPNSNYSDTLLCSVEH